MGRKRIKITFPPNLVTQPIIHTMGKQFDIVTNIRRASVTKDHGWVVLEITGEPSEIDRAVTWAIEQGLEVEPIEGEILPN